MPLSRKSTKRLVSRPLSPTHKRRKSAPTGFDQLTAESQDAAQTSVRQRPRRRTFVNRDHHLQHSKSSPLKAEEDALVTKNSPEDESTAIGTIDTEPDTEPDTSALRCPSWENPSFMQNVPRTQDLRPISPIIQQRGSPQTNDSNSRLGLSKPLWPIQDITIRTRPLPGKVDHAKTNEGKGTSRQTTPLRCEMQPGSSYSNPYRRKFSDERVVSGSSEEDRPFRRSHCPSPHHSIQHLESIPGTHPGAIENMKQALNVPVIRGRKIESSQSEKAVSDPEREQPPSNKDRPSWRGSKRVTAEAILGEFNHIHDVYSVADVDITDVDGVEKTSSASGEARTSSSTKLSSRSTLSWASTDYHFDAGAREMATGARFDALTMKGKTPVKLSGTGKHDFHVEAPEPMMVFSALTGDGTMEGMEADRDADRPNTAEDQQDDHYYSRYNGWPVRFPSMVQEDLSYSGTAAPSLNDAAPPQSLNEGTYKPSTDSSRGQANTSYAPSGSSNEKCAKCKAGRGNAKRVGGVDGQEESSTSGQKMSAVSQAREPAGETSAHVTTATSPTAGHADTGRQEHEGQASETVPTPGLDPRTRTLLDPRRSLPLDVRQLAEIQHVERRPSESIQEWRTGIFTVPTTPRGGTTLRRRRPTTSSGEDGCCICHCLTPLRLLCCGRNPNRDGPIRLEQRQADIGTSSGAPLTPYGIDERSRLRDPAPITGPAPMNGRVYTRVADRTSPQDEENQEGEREPEERQEQPEMATTTIEDLTTVQDVDNDASLHDSVVGDGSFMALLRNANSEPSRPKNARSLVSRRLNSF
ncbi:MAG: hypothetical protein Q9170_006467 [Blastenia crenularia]